MSNLAIVSVFEFNTNQIRVIVQDGQPWFVAKDLCAVLDIQNIRQNLAKLDDDEKGVYSIYTLGGKQDTAIVSESGMYALVLSSRKPEAKPFRKWVTAEVLPTIRKTGSYSLGGKSPDWIKAREEGKDARRQLTDAIKDYIDRHPELSPNQKKFLYTNASEAINLGLFATKAKRLKELLGIGTHQPLRDGLDKKELMCLNGIEFLAVQLIDYKDLDPVEAVREAIAFSHTNQRFAEKVLGMIGEGK